MGKWVVDCASSTTIFHSGEYIARDLECKEFDTYDEAVAYGKEIAQKGTFESEDGSSKPLHYAKLFYEPSFEEGGETVGWDDFIMKGDNEKERYGRRK